MKKPQRIIKTFALLLIFYGTVNLLGTLKYESYALLCSGLPGILISGSYAFGLVYGVMGILCGTRILKYEDWARKTAIVLVLISLCLGLFISPVIVKNLKVLYFELPEVINAQNVPIGTILRTQILFSLIFTVFEILFVYFLTRSEIKKNFRPI